MGWKCFIFGISLLFMIMFFLFEFFVFFFIGVELCEIINLNYF